MRNLGWLLLVAGIGGFLYCSSEAAKVDPLPPDKGIRESVESPAGRWELLRYGCAGAAGVGLLLAMFPRGR